MPTIPIVLSEVETKDLIAEIQSRYGVTVMALLPKPRLLQIAGAPPPTVTPENYLSGDCRLGFMLLGGCVQTLANTLQPAPAPGHAPPPSLS